MNRRDLLRSSLAIAACVTVQESMASPDPLPTMIAMRSNGEVRRLFGVHDPRFLAARQFSSSLMALNVVSQPLQPGAALLLWRQDLNAKYLHGGIIAGVSTYADWMVLRDSALELRRLPCFEFIHTAGGSEAALKSVLRRCLTAINSPTLKTCTMKTPAVTEVSTCDGTLVTWMMGGEVA